LNFAQKFLVRLTIDRAVLRVFGFGVGEVNRLLDYLYPALANEIQQPINTHARITILVIHYYS